LKIAFLAHAGSVHTRRWSLGLASRGHNLRILTQSDLLGHPEGIPTDYLPGRNSLAYFRNIPRVKKILADFDPDIVHAHYATGYGLWGYMQNAAPLVLTVWGTDIADAIEGKIMIAPIVRRALKKARLITGASKFLLEQTAAFEPSVRDKLVRIPFGVKINRPEPVALKKDGPVKIIFAKQFYPVYAPEMVIRGFAEAVRSVADMQLLMIGGGPLQEEMQGLVKVLNLDRSVEIRGWVEMTEAEALIAEADIMVMPSQRESFGVAALEAVAAGLPVIATRVGGIPEIVENETNGLLIEPGDEKALTEAIIRLAENPDLRIKMGEAGRKIAKERFDFENCLDMMEDVYRRVRAA
jgi:glycosyltransferase involved in cell wall biosynthesis